VGVLASGSSIVIRTVLFGTDVIYTRLRDIAS
jgi:hypothetical protein